MANSFIASDEEGDFGEFLTFLIDFLNLADFNLSGNGVHVQDTFVA